MVPSSPADALGSHASSVREVLVEIVQTRHDYAADAHLAAHTRSARGFATQWHDLLVDTAERFQAQGFDLHKLPPAGHKIPIVKNCLIYLWRLPEKADAASHFAASATRKSCFNAPLPDPMLFSPSFDESIGAVPDAPDASEDKLRDVLRDAGDWMTVVLVMVQSSPRQLHSIQWATANLDQQSDTVQLRGLEVILPPELAVQTEMPDVESFDSGTPVPPTVEPQKQERSQPDE